MLKAFNLFSFCFFSSILLSAVFGQPKNIPEKEIYPSNAAWIKYPDSQKSQETLITFRNEFLIETTPTELWVKCSADNRYKLYINNLWIGEGPCRSDVAHWKYEWYNLASYLIKGKNVLSAIQWNYGEKTSISQTTFKPGFWLEAISPGFETLNTNSQSKWRCKSLQISFLPLPKNIG